MTPYGFVEVSDGSDADLQRVLELAWRLSEGRSVLLRLEVGARSRVETMLRSLFPDGDRSRIELLDKGDDLADIPAVQAAGFCVFSDAEMAVHLRDDQVAVYARSWNVA